MKRVAIFDFDHTLILGDSLWPFLTAAEGKVSTYLALSKALYEFVLKKLKSEPAESLRTFVKASLLRQVLAGKRRDALGAAAQQTKRWQKENMDVMRSLKEHHAAGDMIVIASGGLDLYLPELLQDVPHDALICTEIEVKDGIVTGHMVHGNCVRARKAELVASWLALHGPFDDSFGYGNYPHDLPMLNLVKHRIIV